MTILHHSSQDETIPGRGDGCCVTEAIDVLDCGDGRGIAGGTTTTTAPASKSASASALAPTAAAMMAITCCPFDQEVEDRGAKPCVTTTTGGGIADGMTTTAPASPLALASASTAAATINKPRVAGQLRMTTTSWIATRACG